MISVPSLIVSDRRPIAAATSLLRPGVHSALLSTLLVLVSLTAAAGESILPLPDDPACTDEDRRFMARAHELAAVAAAKGNGAFGALVVKDGTVLMEFSNDARTGGDVTHHAETGLVSLATMKLGLTALRDCTFYTSTEPCIMCCGAINSSGVSRLVYGTTGIQLGRLRGRQPRPNPLQVREVFARVRRPTGPPVTVLGPLLEKEGLAVHAAALAKLEPSKP